MIPPEFEYHRPETIDQALVLLTQHGDEAKILAGGHSLLPLMKLRFAEPAHLVDLNFIESLRGIKESNGLIEIAAMTTESQLITSQLLLDKCPLIPNAASQIADPQVRSRGTIGGDIVHADPGNDHPAIMLALEASFVILGSDGERIVPASGFFLGAFDTQLEENEILKAIQVPVSVAGSGHAYCKLKRKTGDFATAASAVSLVVDGGVCKKINIALTNAGATALKAEAAESILTGQTLSDLLIEKAVEKAMAICDPAEDLRGDREYKIHMAGEMTRRAIREAFAKATGGG